LPLRICAISAGLACRAFTASSEAAMTSAPAFGPKGMSLAKSTRSIPKNDTALATPAAEPNVAVSV
jgi:hypothetical protein